MPTTADTPVPPRVRFAPVVLLTALGLALGGLSLTSTADTSQAPVTLARALREGPAPVTLTAAAPVRATSVAVAPVRRKVRATRSRAAAPRWVRPVVAGVVSSYGPRWGRMHEGIDFGSDYGDRVRAVGDGVVLGAGYLPSESGYGNIILVQHRGGAVTAYAHLSRVSVSAGERVRAGEVIGRVGNTGHSTGPHLHFEVRVGGVHVNPRTWLRKRGVWV